MYDTTTFLQSELDYRTERIKASMGRSGKRQGRATERVRRLRWPARAESTIR